MAAPVHWIQRSREATVVQRERVVLKLRELIVGGELSPEQRVAEIPIAERLGVSRTPVRQALAVLAKEGLLTPAGKRGYLVRAFSEKEIFDAIELRGVLEGMAGRLLAERGIGRVQERRLRALVAESGAIAARERYEIEDDAQWAEVNGEFHRLIVETSGNRALVETYQANERLPFVGARALLGADSTEADRRRRHHEVIRRAHLEHVEILGALLSRQGTRVEGLLREHAYRTRDNIVLFRVLV
jgi:GntR family transcriptional regulator of vanillate catabolism